MQLIHLKGDYNVEGFYYVVKKAVQLIHLKGDYNGLRIADCGVWNAGCAIIPFKRGLQRIADCRVRNAGCATIPFEIFTSS